MKADHLSYQRATTVCLLGLGLQLAIGVAMLIHSVLMPQVAVANGIAQRGDQAGMSAALMILMGSGVWLLLAIVFDQHRRERIEAMETEALFASDGTREGSVFNEKADDVRVANKRLNWMHRVVVPVASLVYAGSLIGVGLWRLDAARNYLITDSVAGAFRSSAAPGWAIGIGIATAIVGFFFARYAAGMAKQPVWANLRAGAAVSVGGALIGFLYALGHFIDRLGPDTLARWMHVIVPALMVLIGAEVVLNFLLGLYSPRRPGEYPRAAADSRILGFFAAPDRLAKSIGEAVNYQFGFDVTSSWFYQLLSRSVLALLLTGVVVLWLLTSLSVVQPNEQALRIRFGKRVGETLGPGAYLKMPWPLETIQRFEATAVRRLDLGSLPAKLQNSRSILWTNDHGAETYFLVQPTRAERDAGSVSGDVVPAALDYALVSVTLPLFYRVDDYAKFDMLPDPVGSDPNKNYREELLKGIAKREVLRILSTQDLDGVLGDGRVGVADRIREAVQARFAELNGGQGAGVSVMYVGVQGVHPPKDTAKSFENMVQATYDRSSAVLSAESEANDQLIVVAGSVDKAKAIVAGIERLNTARNTGNAADRDANARQIELEVQDLILSAGGSGADAIQKARSERWTKHMTSRAQSESYVGQIAGFRASPQVYAAKVYFQTMQEALAGSRLYIVGSENVEVRIDAQDINTGGNIFNRATKVE